MATALDESRYRLAYVGLWLVATAAFFGLAVAGYAAVGAAAYGVFGVSAIVLHHRYSGPLFDERDGQILGRASARTLQLFGLAAGITFPTMAALDALEVVPFPTWLSHMGALVFAIYAVWAGFLLLERRQT
ncbi:DUF2178 domain-containing protein [Haloarchaeobius sp. DT45]|uniref:DUF2178 domain-containing protein n=1 Tax=Haloarchaeobius sp. DT45 TaxID=3446116 RepID=UPI003F6B1326